MNFIQKKLKKLHRTQIILLALAGIFLLVLILLIPILFLQKPQYAIVRIKGSPGNWWWVTPRPPDWLANSIKVGDKEYNAMNKATAEVLAVDVYDAGGSTKDVFITAKLEVKYNKRTNKYRYKGEPLEIGGPVALSLNETLFPGMVVAINNNDNSSKKELVEKVLTVRYYDRWPYEFEAIKVGEKVIDGSGNVIAEILDKQQKPAEKEVFSDTGEIFKAFSPVRNDFFIKLRLKMEKRIGELVFREEQYIKVGNSVWILFPGYNFSGAQIISIEN